MSTRKQQAEQMAVARAELRRQRRVVTDEKVLLWRKQAFAGMGFTIGQAQTLAARGEVDVTETREWLDAGCPLETVLRIVAPLIDTSTELAVLS